MTRNFSNEIIEILRRDILRGSSRTIAAANPLGEGGVGLDSLALVELVTALENHYDIDIPEEEWIDRGRLTIDVLAEIVARGLKEDTSGERSDRNGEHIEHGSRPGRGERMRTAFEEQGVLGGAKWIAEKAVKKTTGAAFQQSSFYILSYDLRSTSATTLPNNPELTFRLAELKDIGAAEQIYAPQERQRKRQRFHERISNGHLCYAAWIGNRMVAIDWVTDKTDFEPTTGLTISPSPGSCYGLDLREHPDFKSQGIGMALLGHCLNDCRQRGYRTQFAIVDATNKKMLMASVQLLGFRTVGRIWSKKVIGKTSTQWEINGRTGSDSELVLTLD